MNRRLFLGAATTGLAAGSASACGWLATPSSGSLGAYKDVAKAASGQFVQHVPSVEKPKELKSTEDNILGPYFRPAVPFRGKITPALEPGEPLVVWGRVWSLEKQAPIPHAIIHVWQANAEGRYDNDDPENPPKSGVFANRARLMADETGYYEYETIRPGRYKTGPTQWRPAHIHYFVESPGYQSLVTQMYFKGDPENAKDAFIKPSLIMTPQKVETPRGDLEVIQFDIVLPLAKKEKSE